MTKTCCQWQIKLEGEQREHELPSTTDQVRVRQNKATHITIVARVDFKRVTLEPPGVLAQVVRSNISSLGQKEYIPIQLQPW